MGEWGTIYLASSTKSDATKCAQIGGESKGDPLVIWDCLGEPQQVWKVGSPDPTPEPGPDPTPEPGPDPTPAPGPDPVLDGVQIQSNVTSLCVDLPGGDTSNGAMLWTWDCSGDEAQQWSFQDRGFAWRRFHQWQPIRLVGLLPR